MSYWDKVLSFDIETSSTDPEKDKIWSMGVYGDDVRSNEYFIKTSDRPPAEVIEGLRTSAGSFGQEQMDRGSFTPLFDALSSGNTNTEQEGLQNVFRHIDHNSSILIQNVNFENRFINKIMGDMGEGADDIRDKMRYFSYVDNENTIRSDSILHTPPEVTNQKNAAKYAVQQYLRTGDNKSFDQAEKSYDAMMKEYSRVTREGKGAVTVDLMDVTKATYAKAASQGFLKREHANAGTSVEFLSKILLDGEKESHTALSDAKQQKQIYQKMSGIYGELLSGNVSEDTQYKLSQIRAGQPYDSSRQFIKSLDSIMGEFESNGFARVRLDQFGTNFGLREEEVFAKVSVHDRAGGSQDIFVKNYRAIDNAEYGSRLAYFKTQSRQEAVDDVLRRFQNIETPGFNKQEFANRYLNNEVDVPAEERALKAKTMSNIDSPKSKLNQTVDRAADALSGITDKVKNLENKHWVGLALLATGGAVYAASGGNEEGAALKKREEDRQKKSTLDYQLKTFTRPQTYHGSSLADWKERTGHHQY